MKSIHMVQALALAVSFGAAVGAAGLAQAADSAVPAPAKPAAKAWTPYAPVALPAAPDVKQRAWVRSPIDAFILAKLETAGLKPAPEADRATYIRRATLDAWGILPTPEEVRDFVADKSPQAHEKLVDRLLASPHYGERQARRWLDLARYADSAGFQGDETRPNNWRYRDYVINAFNSDKPFDRFVKEQIAGDELWPDSQEARIATGYLAGYPDNSNSRDLVQRKYQIETDMTDLVGETLLGATIGCARCHNHKADKVSQKEYFQLQAFFANTAFDPAFKLKEKAEVDTDWEKKQAAYREATKSIREQQDALLAGLDEKAVKYQKERYLTDSRESLFKPQAEWNALDRWVNWRHKVVSPDRAAKVAYLKLSAEDKDSPEYNPANVEKWKAYEKLNTELKKFDKIRQSANTNASLTTAIELGSEAPPTHLRFGGIHERPTETVQPGIPALWNPAGATVDVKPLEKSSGRRTALAQWLTSDKNGLTSRVYVNRVWSQYFDKGLVSTVGDFGRAGAKPTHPELLDYLAGSFVQNGWSVKKLTRELLLSATYRQSSAERADVVKADPDNKLLAVFPRKRLEAEEIRDSLLYASGQLVDKVGGPAVFPPVPDNLNAGPLWQKPEKEDDSRRRSIYTFVRRSVPYPLTVSFDPAGTNNPHQKRDVTTTPLQALTLFNSDIVFAWSQALAGRVINESGRDEAAQIDRLYEVLFSRKATAAEKTTLKAFLAEQEKVVAAKLAEASTKGTYAVAVPTGLKSGTALNPVRAAAFVDLVHTVANSNDFAYRF
ncbi:MAG TPA: DUF1549 and DUF1553 domain-containing protein [Roseateles sp.]